MIVNCPICLEKNTSDTIKAHFFTHGFDDIQANILLNYDKKLKGLIDNINVRIPSFDKNDQRFILYRLYLISKYKFCTPSSTEYYQLNVGKSISELVGIYIDIVGCQVYLLNDKIQNGNVQSVEYAFELSVLFEIYNDIKSYLNRINENQSEPEVRLDIGNVVSYGVKNIIFSWEHVEFGDRKININLSHRPNPIILNIPSSQVLLNPLKEVFFMKRYADKKFNIYFSDAYEIDNKKSSFHQLEDILIAEYENIDHLLKKIEIQDRKKSERINEILVNNKINKQELNNGKHKYIIVAGNFLSEGDNVYSIKENNNGKEESVILFEFPRINHNYVLIENENINRSAHLFRFEKHVSNYVAKLAGFYFSETANKRLLIKDKQVDLKSKIIEASETKVLYHSDLKTYKDHLEHSLYILN